MRKFHSQKKIKMKFSYRIAALMLFVICAVLLYFTQWLTKGRLGAVIWRSNDGYHGSLTDTRRWSGDPDSNNPSNGRQNRLLKRRPVKQCSLNGKVRSPADLRSWEILEKLSPEEPAKMFRNGVVVNNNEQGDNIVTNPVADAQSRKRQLKVILVPHSHSDPGWHKTVDGYFEDQTKPTLDNMVVKLMKFPKMTFIWAESVFLSLWYKDLDDSKKADVLHLLKEGRLEIVVGSWVVPDEANPHYYALIDQMIEGHQWLWHNLKTKPNNTWALDPFGYSSALPYLYKKAGYQNMVILRVHELVKNELIKMKALDFMWRQVWDHRGENDIRTQLMPYKLYNIKHTCGPDHHICLLFDFRKIPGEVSESRAEPITPQNVDRLSRLLLGQYEKKARLFKHNVLLVPLGDDFRYDREIEWDQQYKNYMTLFNHMNNKKEWNVHAKFGTIQDFYNELDAELEADPELKLPSLEGDFFPYTDEHNDFWTGYFTSRAYDKNLGREVESHIRLADMFNAIAIARAIKGKDIFAAAKDNYALLEESHQSLGLFQHHDAITGTARSYVVIDYEKRLNKALTDTETVILNSAQYILNGGVSPTVQLDIDDAYSLKSIMETKKIIRLSKLGTDVIFLNSLAQQRSQMVHLLIAHDSVEVITSEGYIILSQVSPVWKTMELSDVEYELVFYVTLPPMGMKAYTIRVTERNAGRNNTASVIYLYNTQDYRVPKSIRFHILPPSGQAIILENDNYRLRFSFRTGLMHSVTTKNVIRTTKLNMQYLMYKSRGSGAYIFYPSGPAIDSEMSSRPAIRVIKGPLMSEVHVLHKILTSKVRIYNTDEILASAISIENTVDMSDMDDKELVMRVSTDIRTEGLFYTDMNGITVVRRKRNPAYSVQANYYPMTSMAYIEDKNSRLSIITGQPLGVTSPEDGGLEVMLDRRLRYDDGRGLGEGVLDNKITPSRFFLTLEHVNYKSPSAGVSGTHFAEKSLGIPMSSIQNHLLSEQLNYPVFTLFAKNNSKVSKREFQALTQSLPCDVRVVSLRTLKNEGIETKPNFAMVFHKLGYDCNYPHMLAMCPSHGNISFDKLFNDLPISQAQETSLSLMHNKRRQPVSEVITFDPMELYSYKIGFD